MACFCRRNSPSSEHPDPDPIPPLPPLLTHPRLPPSLISRAISSYILSNLNPTTVIRSHHGRRNQLQIRVRRARMSVFAPPFPKANHPNHPLTLRLKVMRPSSLTFTQIGVGLARLAQAHEPLPLPLTIFASLSLSPVSSFSVTLHRHSSIAS